MRPARRPTSRRARRAVCGLVVVVLAAAAVAALGAWRHAADAAAPIPAPAHVALVYARPVGNGFAARREVVYAASPIHQRPRRLAVGTSPLLSPDGRWVAYVGGAKDRPTIRVIPARGGRSRGVAVSGAPVSWSWNSRLVAVEAPLRLVLVDVRSLRTRVLRVPDGSGAFSFSPEGDMLAFEHRTGAGSDVYTVTVRSDEVRRLTDDGRSETPLWGPGGVAFERYGPGDCATCRGDVWVMSGSGGEQRRVTHTDAGIYPAAWSADGRRLLAAYPAVHDCRLFAVAVATGAARPLTPFVGDLFRQGLSRDGRTVLAAIGCGGLATPYGLVETIPFTGGRASVLARGPCRASSNF